MKRKIPIRYLRIASMLFFVALVVVGLTTHLAPGTLSSIGVGDLALICPLGSLEVLLASRSFIPLAVASLVCVFVVAVCLGKVFCGWVCPVPLFRHVFPEKKREGVCGESGDGAQGIHLAQSKSSARDKSSAKVVTCEQREESAQREDGSQGVRHVREADCVQGACVEQGRGGLRSRLASRFIVLAGALGTTAVFGFPVFCLVCPVGLCFGLVIGVWRLIGFNEPSWWLVIFPEVLVLELGVFRKWCHKICPLGALLSLFASFNTRLRPQVDMGKCLKSTQGMECNACVHVCFEGINLHESIESRPLRECTKCLECSHVCPAQAISFRRPSSAMVSSDKYRS